MTILSLMMCLMLEEQRGDTHPYYQAAFICQGDH